MASSANGKTSTKSKAKRHDETFFSLKFYRQPTLLIHLKPFCLVSKRFNLKEKHGGSWKQSKRFKIWLLSMHTARMPRQPMPEKLTELFKCIWMNEAIKQEFKDAPIIHLYKRKGNPQVCDNHRDTSLLSIAGKILAKILLNHLNVHLDQAGLIPESRCGFMKN